MKIVAVEHIAGQHSQWRRMTDYYSNRSSLPTPSSLSSSSEKDVISPSESCLWITYEEDMHFFRQSSAAAQNTLRSNQTNAGIECMSDIENYAKSMVTCFLLQYNIFLSELPNNHYNQSFSSSSSSVSTSVFQMRPRPGFYPSWSYPFYTKLFAAATFCFLVGSLELGLEMCRFANQRLYDEMQTHVLPGMKAFLIPPASDYVASVVTPSVTPPPASLSSAIESSTATAVAVAKPMDNIGSSGSVDQGQIVKERIFIRKPVHYRVNVFAGIKFKKQKTENRKQRAKVSRTVDRHHAFIIDFFYLFQVGPSLATLFQSGADNGSVEKASSSSSAALVNSMGSSVTS